MTAMGQTRLAVSTPACLLLGSLGGAFNGRDGGALQTEMGPFADCPLLRHPTQKPDTRALANKVWDRPQSGVAKSKLTLFDVFCSFPP